MTRQNHKCRVDATPPEKDAHKIKEKPQRHEKQQRHKVALGSDQISLEMQELVSKYKRLNQIKSESNQKQKRS